MSDEHPNVVRCFAMEEDREFVYLALERCRATLSDWLATPQVGLCRLNWTGSHTIDMCARPTVVAAVLRMCTTRLGSTLEA